MNFNNGSVIFRTELGYVGHFFAGKIVSSYADVYTIKWFDYRLTCDEPKEFIEQFYALDVCATNRLKAKEALGL